VPSSALLFPFVVDAGKYVAQTCNLEVTERADFDSVRVSHTIVISMERLFFFFLETRNLVPKNSKPKL